MGYKWSEEDTELLKREYLRSTNDKLRELFPNRTDLAIYKKARKLGFYKEPDIIFENKSKALSGENGANWNGGIRKTQTGYIQILMPDHPRADTAGYVMQHILVFEEHTGISVPTNCAIHHLNGNKSDNRIENLCLMDKIAHTVFHHTGAKRSKETKEKISAKAKERLSDKRNHPAYKEISRVELIRLKESGMMIKDIALKYGINRTTVWKKIKEEENDKQSCISRENN